MNQGQLYHTVIFVYDYLDPDVARLMEDVLGALVGAERALAEYLAQWDCGEYHDDPEPLPWGQFGDTPTDHALDGKGDYTLAVNHALGYASLHVAAPRDTDNNREKKTC